MGNVPSISGIAAGQNRSIIGISYNGEQATALTQGQVDAVTTWEPSITKIQSSGDTQILADGTDPIQRRKIRLWRICRKLPISYMKVERFHSNCRSKILL